MAVMLNMVVVDPKPISVAKNVKSKGDKSDTDFAKKLDVATDKSDIDADSKGQNDANAQLMAAMAGLMAPMTPVVINPVPTNQVSISDLEKGSGNQNVGQVVAVAPKAVEPQLSLAVPSALGQNQESVVPNTSLQAQESPVSNQALQVPVISVVPNPIQAPVSVVPSGIPAEQLANVVSAKVTSNEQLNTNIAPNSDPTQNQLAAVVEKMTAVNPQVIDKQLAEVIKLQTQLQNAGQLQNEANSGQIQVTEVATKNTDTLMANPVLAKLIPTAPVTGNSNGLIKNSTKQIDSKKAVDGPVNIVAPEVNELFGTTEEITVKPVLASQVTATVLDAMVSESKEQLNTIVPNAVSKDSDVFATLLNQQGIKVQSQSPVEMSPAPQPVADPYSITSQIVDQARLVAGAKNTEMIIQLKPEHLGELTFKVSVENGVVSASFHSNNSEVRNVIESSLYQLKQEMSNQGLKIDNVGVYAGLGEFFSNGQQSSKGNQQSGAKVQNKKTDEDFLEAFEATDSAGKVVSATGVDYRA